ncbi:hypothetical protein [Couchioplanes azureus]|uniref:hypothetical protein n=1 Tax=Couchioplanes caeruleus TaxID=56438 RepID=UPI0016706293|nr:hypothetical protein [Couchioplanes caeruleus]GGQ87190.1 hypothetical protein GCM10010166_66630 [Couchioplanes caeruleus subsp. azureus]
MPEEHRTGLRRALAWTSAASVLMSVAFLIAPPMGTDLAAQQARADFFGAHGTAPVDFGWYGGVAQFGYSLLTAPLGSLVGMRVLGAVAAVGASVAFQWLLWRTDAHRPLLGGLLGAVVFAANLVSGRITFAVGLALALAALGLAAAGPGVPDRARRGRVAGVVALSALATWASPVAGLFTGLAGAAVLLAAASGPRVWVTLFTGPRWREAWGLCVGPVLALAPMALLFGNGGRQPFTAESMRIHVALAVLVILVVPARRKALRIGAVLTVVLLVGAFSLASPVGSNALRLPMLFTIPVIAAYADLGRARLALLLAAVFWWQPFVVTSDLARAGSAESRAEFYRPLVEELRRRAPGRVEVVPLRDHWESAYVAREVPLARGWERQVDTDRNALFYRDELTAADYAGWLRAQAVSYVAIAPGSVPDRYARTEAALVRGGLPQLRPVWQDGTWQLFEVVDAQPLVCAPGELVRSDRGGVTVRVPAGADVLVRVRWSRWLRVVDSRSVSLTPGPDGWTRMRATAAGEYRLTSHL